MRKIVIFLFCMAGALLNILFGKAHNILYLDTIFTITATLLAGPWWGCPAHAELAVLDRV